jgi:NADH-quinone oxidoreductase subunit N
MLMMASSRDLISIFVALETISIPTYLLAGFKKWDRKSNEAMLKYFLFGVLSSAVMLYGMSLVYGVAGSTLLTDIAETAAAPGELEQVFTVGVFLTLVGFAFKISAAPFHFWTPDTYEGAPTPVTAFLSVASKAGGFVGIFPLIYVGFYAASDTWQPLLWALAALSMTVGNVIAIRQTNVVRMLAYSSIAQAGFMLVPFAVAPDGGARDNAFEATVIYMLVYGAMNMGAFACVIAIARRTKSGEISSFGGLFEYAPALAVCMSLFLFSLAGVPQRRGRHARHHRRGQLGGRVLLLRQHRPADVLQPAGRRRSHAHPHPHGTAQQHRDVGPARRRRRHLPAALRPPRRADAVHRVMAGGPSSQRATRRR